MNRLTGTVEFRAIVYFSGVGVISLAILLADVWEGMNRLAGVMATLFIIYGILVAKSTERARRKDDKDAIDDAWELALQCRHIVEMIMSMMETSREGEVPKALEYLSTKTSLFVTRYRKYLRPGTARMIMETEQMVVRARVYGVSDLPKFVEILEARIGGINQGILDVDDSTLRKARRAI